MERIVVIGGGLAGLTCAKQLAERGLEVTVYEGMPHLGGRASTWRDADGHWVEQGLHLFLGTYTELRRMLDEIGRPAPGNVVHWLDEIRYEEVGGPSATYAINPLTSPVKTLLRAIGQNRYLGPADKLRAVPVFAPAVASMDTLRRRYDGITVTDWCKQQGGSDALLERFLRPFCRAIQFTDADDFSAFALLGLVHQVLTHLPDSLAGSYIGPRDTTMFEPWAAHLRRLGVTIETGRKLAEVLPHSSRTRRVSALRMEDGERVEADAYVLAIPFWELLPRLPARWSQEPFFAGLGTLPIAPAISVQLWFNRQVVHTPHYTLVSGSEVAVYQEQSTLTYLHPGSRLSVIFSPADAWMHRSDDDIVTRTLEALAGVQPDVKRSALDKAVVLKHEHHLLRPLPGALSRRPSQVTPVPNLFLAGDWTEQDYFGSQEGAVRSGLACADAVGRAASGVT